MEKWPRGDLPCSPHHHPVCPGHLSFSGELGGDTCRLSRHTFGCGTHIPGDQVIENHRPLPPLFPHSCISSQPLTSLFREFGECCAGACVCAD